MPISASTGGRTLTTTSPAASRPRVAASNEPAPSQPNGSAAAVVAEIRAATNNVAALAHARRRMYDTCDSLPHGEDRTRRTREHVAGLGPENPSFERTLPLGAHDDQV